MAFEAFTPTAARARVMPAVSIGRGGLGISSGFARKYSATLANATNIKLFFDKERTAIGFQLVPATDEGSLKLKPLNKGGYYVNARSFLVSYDIDRDRYDTRYIPTEEQTPLGTLFVIELKRKG